MHQYHVDFYQLLGLSELGAKIDARKDPTIVKPRYKRGNIRETHHEVLQRIDSETDVYNHYQQHWFSASLEVRYFLNVILHKKTIEVTNICYPRSFLQ